MGVEPTLNHLVTSSKQILPPYMQSFRCRDILPVAKKECLIRIINYPKEKVQPKYVSKLCFYVKLTIDRILLICIMQFFCSSKHTLPKNSRIYIFVSYLPIMSVPNFYFLSIIFSCVFADNTQPPWRNWLARSAVNRKVGGSSPPRDVQIFLLIKRLFFEKTAALKPHLLFSATVSDTSRDVVSERVGGPRPSKDVHYLLL